MVRFCSILILATLILGPRYALADDQPTEPRDTLKVASLMYRPIKWDKETNTKNIETAIRDACQRGAQVVVTPEGALEGYLVNDVRMAVGQERCDLTERFNAIAEPADGPYIQRFQKLCKELKVYLVLGFLEASDGKTYNTAIVIGPDGKTVGKYQKTHFAQGYKMGVERKNNPVGYTRGTDYPVFDVAGQKMGVMICYDRRVPKVATGLKKSGADFIVNPAYGMMGDSNRRFISARAKETQLPVLFVHPNQTVFATADTVLRADLRPRKNDVRQFIVEIEKK